MKALITGISGQDGQYLAELLLKKNYEIYGLSRETLTENKHSNINYIASDVANESTVTQLVKDIQPNEIYHLASQSSPMISWQDPKVTTNINCLGTLFLLNAIKNHAPFCKMFHASSSEMFGEIQNDFQHENTPFRPLNPYAVTKIYSHQLSQTYRKAYGLFISCGILFNHESVRRGMHFITQKVTYAAACIKLGITNSIKLNERGIPIVNQGKLTLGSLDSQKDWGHAKDYIKAMWLMLNHHEPDDFVIGTGKLHSIEELCQIAFSHVNLDWKKFVIIDKKLSRPANTGPACADISKIKNLLSWQPEISFKSMISEMVDHHLGQLHENDLTLDLTTEPNIF